MKTAKECWISNGLNPDYYIDSVEAAMEEYAAQRTPASGSLPPVIYVEQGDSSLGRDSEGREYYIKHVSNDDAEKIKRISADEMKHGNRAWE